MRGRTHGLYHLRAVMPAGGHPLPSIWRGLNLRYLMVMRHFRRAGANRYSVTISVLSISALSFVRLKPGNYPGKDEVIRMLDQTGGIQVRRSSTAARYHPKLFWAENNVAPSQIAMARYTQYEDLLGTSAAGVATSSLEDGQNLML